MADDRPSKRRRSARTKPAAASAAAAAPAAAGLPLLRGNEYLDHFTAQHAAFPPDMARLLDPELPGGEARRAELIGLIDGEAALKYAWAVPDERALRVLAHHGPIVEVGCGRGYWARLLRDRGVDVVAFDHKLPPTKQRWTALKKGGPEVLAAHSSRALLLCYPDDFEDSDESMAARCLRHYTGDTVIHVGELLGEGCCLPSPWGRTTDAEFQVELNTTFHKVLQVPLPSWPCSRDSLTVWKRTTTLITGEGVFAHVPAEERLAVSEGVAAPSLAHLLGT